MKKSIFYTLGVLLLTFVTLGVSADAAKVDTHGLSLTIPTVTNKQTEISGTATKNTPVYVKLDNKKTVATTTASSDGKYTLKLPKKYAANTNLYVYVQPSKANYYFYKIITVKSNDTSSSSSSNSASSTSSSSSSSSSKTSTTSSSSSSSTKTVAKVSDLAGNWKSSASGKYTQLWTFNNDTGLNQTQYKNKKYDSKILSNAVYNVKNVNGNVITMTYRGKGVKKTSTMYIRLVSSKKFYLVDKNNKLLKLKVGNAPTATYSFTKIK
ncbi:Ig-like domain-containing protein [Nicoliella lavandulae]|uniref:Ig-like domain-containing protein n=1 Tax=Nicoliella lavandulae TaxID=3082954 RepID=A0ABU8SJG5_9LACO